MNKSIKDRIEEQKVLDPEFKKAYEDLLFAEEFAVEIVKLRKAAHLTQNQVSDLTGLKQVEISRIENLKKVPTVTTMERILHVFNKKLSISNR